MHFNMCADASAVLSDKDTCVLSKRLNLQAAPHGLAWHKVLWLPHAAFLCSAHCSRWCSANADGGCSRSTEHRYDDAYAYQNVFGPLVALEAAHDRAMKESQVHCLRG